MRSRSALSLAAAAAVALVACGGEPDTVPSPDVDTAGTAESAEVSEPADGAVTDARPDAASTGTVTVDEVAVPVDEVACEGGAVTVTLADGGELELTSDDGAIGVTLALVDAPGPGTWADPDVEVGTAGQERLSVTADRAMGEAALGAGDDGDDEVVVAFDLACP